MSDIVSIEYQQMSKVAQTFEQESAHVKKLLADINTQLNILRRGGWIADAANKFYQEMDSDVCPRVQRLQTALEHSGNVCAHDLQQLFHAATDEACACLPTA
ncbi:MAG: WXG100 family type VII secretion target [Anaerolineae bacterium]|nr:WXG100 family type VII secretion target [Anaerolineae bacterium]